MKEFLKWWNNDCGFCDLIGLIVGLAFVGLAFKFWMWAWS